MQLNNPSHRLTELAVGSLLMVLVSSLAADESAPSDSYHEQILLDGPVVYYRFEQPVTAEVTDHAGAPGEPQQGVQPAVRQGATAFDDGALSAAQQHPSSNRSASFDGVDDRIQVRLPATNDVLELAGSFTIELWVRPGSKESYQQLLAKGDYYGKGQTTFFLLCMPSGSGKRDTRSLRVGIGNGQPPDAAFDANSEIPVHAWSHVAVTYESRTGRTAIYVNGCLDTKGRFTAAPPTFPGHALTLGALSGDPTTDTLVNFFHGQLDEVAIYGRVLEGGQIARHYALATGKTPPAPPPTPQFEEEIRPILAAACFDCHGADSQEQGLDLRTVTAMLQGGESGAVIERGNPAASLLLTLVENGQMPPDEGARLSPGAIEQLRAWIEAGAPAKENVREPELRRLVSDKDREHWAFQKAVKPAVGSADSQERVRMPIDALAVARLREQGLSFSPDADRLTLLRRAYFDLIGLPPSPEDVAEFLADTDPDAYRHLIDRLLESRHYGERWGRHWLDVVGYSDTGEIDNDLGTVVENVGIWQYRDWVIRAINEDLPYDQFLSMHLAGDEMIDWRNAETFTPAIRDHLIATGLASHVQDHTDHAQYGRKERFDVLTQIMETFSSGVLGVTMACAQCHDHKYEPFPQRDYYRLMACFMPAFNPDNWVRRSDRHLADVSQAEKASIDKQNGDISAQVASLTEEITAIEARQKKKSSHGDTSASNAEVQARLDTLRTKIESVRAGQRSYGRIPAMWDVGPVPDTFLLRRGSHDQHGARVRPGFPAVLTEPEDGLVAAKRPDQTQGASSGMRLALAQWLTRSDSRAAGLVARVIVNHIWSHHFGTGIVATPGNLGRTGSPPTHPELLDWLAADFIEHGWKRKTLHRQIMLSTVYRQRSQRSSDGQPLAGEAVDPQNKWLWRQNVRRLEAEAVRDSVLAVSGKLDVTAGGPAMKLDSRPDGMSTVKRDGSPTGPWRRSVYVFVRRNYPLKFLEIFDAPIVPLNCTHRSHSATVLQSLTLLNDPFLLEHADYVSELVADTVNLENARQTITACYLRILSRGPGPVELARCEDYLVAQMDLYCSMPPDRGSVEASRRAVADLCHMLMCANEFLYIQ